MPDYTLKDEEINISDKTKIDCSFGKGYTYKENYNTFSHKDVMAMNILSSLILLIVCGIYILFNNKYKHEVLILIIIIGFGILINLIQNPVKILYLFSYFITINTRTAPFLDLDEFFENHIKFENPETFSKIQKETLNILRQKDKLKLTKNTRENDYIGGGNVQSDNEDGWRIYVVKLGSNNFAEDTMPELTKILKEVPEVVSCVVSILPAKKAIPIHIGYSKGVIRYQLAMKIPKDRENVFICVNGQKYSWTEGEGVLFDDMYPHKVFNNTDEDRVILYMDVIRPFLNPVLNIMNKFSIYLITNSSITKDEIAKTEKQIDIDKSLFN